MIPTRANLDVQHEHPLEKVATAIHERFGFNVEIEYPEDPDWVNKDIGLWLLYIELPSEDDETDDHIAVQWRPHSGFRLVCPGDYVGEVQDDDWRRMERTEDVIDFIVAYLTGE